MNGPLREDSHTCALAASSPLTFLLSFRADAPPRPAAAPAGRREEVERHARRPPPLPLPCSVQEAEPITNVGHSGLATLFLNSLSELGLYGSLAVASSALRTAEGGAAASSADFRFGAPRCPAALLTPLAALARTLFAQVPSLGPTACPPIRTLLLARRRRPPGRRRGPLRPPRGPRRAHRCALRLPGGDPGPPQGAAGRRGRPPGHRQGAQREPTSPPRSHSPPSAPASSFSFRPSPTPLLVNDPTCVHPCPPVLSAPQAVILEDRRANGRMSGESPAALRQLVMRVAAAASDAALVSAVDGTPPWSALRGREEHSWLSHKVATLLRHLRKYREQAEGRRGREDGAAPARAALPLVATAPSAHLVCFPATLASPSALSGAGALPPPERRLEGDRLRPDARDGRRPGGHALGRAARRAAPLRRRCIRRRSGPLGLAAVRPDAAVPQARLPRRLGLRRVVQPPREAGARPGWRPPPLGPRPCGAGAHSWPASSPHHQPTPPPLPQPNHRPPQLLHAFRRGRRNLIVSTEVLEEGIDVPQCSLVAVFDELKDDLASFIQRRGRARHKGARARSPHGPLHSSQRSRSGSEAEPKRRAEQQLQRSADADAAILPHLAGTQTASSWCSCPAPQSA